MSTFQCNSKVGGVVVPPQVSPGAILVEASDLWFVFPPDMK